MEPVVKSADNQCAWTIVSDDNCPVVRFLARLVHSCDRQQFFRFVGWQSQDEYSQELMQELSRSPWSLVLIDDGGRIIQGPEAIPFILKNLPSGRLFCVAYLIPGTMWITRQLYLYVSRNRKRIAALKLAQSQNGPGQAA